MLKRINLILLKLVLITILSSGCHSLEISDIDLESEDEVRDVVNSSLVISYNQYFRGEFSEAKKSYNFARKVFQEHMKFAEDNNRIMAFHNKEFSEYSEGFFDRIDKARREQFRALYLNPENSDKHPTN